MNKRTQQFLALSINEKRIAIAQDVIQQVRLEKFNPERGTYNDIHLPGNYEICEIENQEKSMQSVLKDSGAECTVCARGAIFLSTIRKSNQYSVKEFLDGSGEGYCPDAKVENKYFTKETTLSMERVFEDNIYNDDSESDFVLFIDNECGNSSVDRDTFALVAICRNVIENNGNWKPEKLVKKFPQWINYRP
jgi:hypothetical protein